MDSKARMELPIYIEYLCSGRATILIFIMLGARALISICVLSTMLGYMVALADSIMLAYRSFWMLMSCFMMELDVVLWMLQDSIPRKEGWKSASGCQNCLLLMVITSQFQMQDGVEKDIPCPQNL